jgi:hypothetical protein
MNVTIYIAKRIARCTVRNTVEAGSREPMVRVRFNLRSLRTQRQHPDASNPFIF